MSTRSESRINNNRTIPIRVSKQSANIAEIHYYEMSFTFFFTQSCTTSDNLLKLCHGSDHFIQNNELRHLTVRTGRQKLGCGCNDGIWRRDGNEVIQLLLAIIIASSNTHHIIRILFDHIRVQIHQRLTHTLRSIFCGTEHNGFSHSICAFKIACYF